MKLRYIIPTFMAAITLMLASCEKDDAPTYQSGLRVSTSFVSFCDTLKDDQKDSVTVYVNSSTEWAFEKIFQVITKNDDGTKDTTYQAAPEWVTLTPESGMAGETAVTMVVGATVDGRTATLKLVNKAGLTQEINIIQGVSTVSEATCAEVIAGPDSKTYRVSGTVTAIANTTYGNWYLNDGTGEIYIYGTLDKDGKTKNFLSLGLEVGDGVTVEGPKTTYNGTVELVDVSVVKITKSLIKVDSLSIADGTLPLEGGNVTAYVSCKGQGISVEIPEDAKDWLFITAMTSDSVVFRALPNTGGDRSTTITLTTTDGKKEYTSQTTISQKGAIVAATVAEFLAAEVGDTQYRLTGVITKVAKAEYGNVYVRDFSGEVYVYGIGAKGDFEAAGLKEGDVVTLVGKRAVYNDTPQMKGSVLESSIPVTKVTIDEFLTKEDSKDVYYMVSGTLDEIVNPTYGNLYLKDGDSRLYVYGCYPGWGATGDARKNHLETAGIAVGDKLTVIGVKSTYNGQPQVANGIYFSHEKAE